MKISSTKFCEQWKQVLLPRHQPRAICTLKQYEWTYLSKLLYQGYPFLDAIYLVRSDLHLQQYLEQGMNIKEILLQGHRGSFYQHMCFFLPITSLQEAISSSLSMEAFEKNVKQKFLKQTSYPMIIFLFSFVTLYVFSSMIIPQLMQSFDLEHEQSFLRSGVSILQGFAIIFFVLVLFILLSLFVARIHQRCKIILLQYCRSTSLPQAICSYRLAGYYAQLIHHGIPTRHAFAFLTQLDHNSLISLCAKQIVEQLEEGKELIEILADNMWISKEFLQCWRIGLHTQDMEMSLKQYMERQEDVWMIQIKRVGMIIQAVAYGFVGLMVLLVYQIMLVPLQILETM